MGYIGNNNFPIVGIGASAGGLDTIIQFLKHVPEVSDAAFVVAQHLHPAYDTGMAELLQRSTSRKVVQARNRMRVVPKRVYVIPPDKDMSILHGMLHLFESTEPIGKRRPIDFFFCSLAHDRMHLSAGVILSGEGSDGAIGLRTIKEKGGLVLVQEPSSARYSGMPQSAIGTGFADIVAPVEQLPEKLIEYFKHGPSLAKRETVLDKEARGGLEQAISLIRDRKGHDFSMYRMNALYRRIERRMGVHQADGIGAYVRYLSNTPEELEILFKEMLIGVTSFFRDPAAWAQLKKKIVDDLLPNWPAGKTLRAWTPGCSTGEEAYSLAMILKEAVEDAKYRGRLPIQIFATDPNNEAIDKARRGMFPVHIASDISPDLLEKYFTREDSGYAINKGIRGLVTFSRHNLLSDPPFTKLDILACRNLLIYLASEVYSKLVPLFHYALRAGGILFLGNAETICDFGSLFVSADAKFSIYNRLATEKMPGTFVEFLPTSTDRTKRGGEPGAFHRRDALRLAADKLLKEYAPAFVVVNTNGDILYVSGNTGKYLEPAAGDANLNVFDMAREELRCALHISFKKALKQEDAVIVDGLKVPSDGRDQFVGLTVKTLAEPEELRGAAVIVFRDQAMPQGVRGTKSAGSSKKDRARMKELEQAFLWEIDEMKTDRKDMQNSMKEVATLNETLQSMNEELAVSREELLSSNIDLTATNTDQLARIEELTCARDEARDLLDSTGIALVLLDNELNLHRFTKQAADTMKLMATDIGRPITEFSSPPAYSTLEDDARRVLRDGISVERQIATNDGRRFAVRIIPHSITDEMKDGLAITFTDI